MATIDTLVAQFAAAIDAIAADLQTEIDATQSADAAKLQPFADRLTALAANPLTPGAPAPAAEGTHTAPDTGPTLTTPTA